jgi:6-phosphogluconolactonase
MPLQKTQVRFFSSPEDLARAAAIELHGLLQRRNTTAPFGIALSGGRIAKPFCAELVNACIKSPPSLEEVHFFCADERCVPPADAESNFHLARTNLFEPLKIPPGQVHRILGETDPPSAVNQAEAEICRIMPLNDDGQPILDLVILGMGEDGHVASLFPGESEELVKSSEIFRFVTAVKPPPKRVTLGYAPILVATEVWILISGAGKKDAFERLIRGDETLPVTRIVQRRQKTSIFEDIAPL